VSKATLRMTCHPWLTYAPVHVAEELALFRKHDVTVELHGRSVGWIELLRLLSDGESDIILGNMWLAPRRIGSGMVAVAACAWRCRFMPVGRSEGRSGDGEFASTNVRAPRSPLPATSPTPWFAFREVLTRSGIRLDRCADDSDCAASSRCLPRRRSEQARDHVPIGPIH
jgi:hypothetical protein